VTAKGTPIKNGQLVADLLDAMLLPKELAVVKVKAHTHLDTPEARGNVLADDASRKAARQKRGGKMETWKWKLISEWKTTTQNAFDWKRNLKTKQVCNLPLGMHTRKTK